MQARQHRASIQAVHKTHYGSRAGGIGSGNMSSMELGMYVLLTAFCFAIIVFVISCVVYASKFRPAMIESGLDPLSGAGKTSGNAGAGGFRDVRLKESTTNAHDWVWLGRSTIDRHSLAVNDTVNNAQQPQPQQQHINARGKLSVDAVDTRQYYNNSVADSRMRITSNPIINYDNGRRVSSFDQQQPQQQPPKLQTHIVPASNLNKIHTDK